MERASGIAERDCLAHAPRSSNQELLGSCTGRWPGTCSAAIPNAGSFVEFSIEPDINAGEVFYRPALRVQDGKVKIPDGPGWGVEINPAWLERASYMKSERAR